jgi:hypothetical protein
MPKRKVDQFGQLDNYENNDFADYLDGKYIFSMEDSLLPSKNCYRHMNMITYVLKCQQVNYSMRPQSSKPEWSSWQ